MTSKELNFSGRWIADLLRSEIRHPSERRVGIEIERIGMWSDFTPLQYSDTQLPSGEIRFGAMSLLSQLSKKYHWPTINNPQGKTIGLTTPVGKVSLEPGSQVELSSDPFSDLITVKQKVSYFETAVSELTTNWGLSWIGLGVNPINSISEIELIPSTRYEIMTDFLDKRALLGTSMMKRTSSVQINLDYTSEEEAIEMLRVSLLVAPVSYALFANSPFSEGVKTDYQSFRGKIWQETDPSRTGLLPEAFKDNFGFDEYANYLWQEPLMFVQNEKTKYLPGEGLSLDQIKQGKLMGVTCSEMNQLNSMRELFCEARIKLGYVEVRSIDGLLPEYRDAASAFWLGVLYSPTARKEAFNLLGKLNTQERQELFNSSLKIGLKAKQGAVSLSHVARVLVEVAESELKARGFGEEKLLEPLKRNVKINENPASLILKKFRDEWNSDIKKVVEYTRQ